MNSKTVHSSSSSSRMGGRRQKRGRQSAVRFATLDVARGCCLALKSSR